MSQSSSPAQPAGAPGEKGLKSGAVGLLGSVVIGMASTAPAYSLAASLGLIVASSGMLVAGEKAPGIMLLAFVPMFLIALAYRELNRAEPDAGTTFTWATRAFGAVTGWLGGWGIIAADVIVMANLAQVAGSYSFTLLGSFGLGELAPLASDTAWTMVVGLAWIAVMTWVAYRGIEVSARLQYLLLSIEVVVLIVFAVVALVRVTTGNAEPYSMVPQWSWFNPFDLDWGQALAPALLTAIFLYWGWDTAVTINEETRDPDRTPGRAAVISTLLLLVTYALVATAAVAFAGVGTEGVGLGNPDNADDAFLAIGGALFGDSFWGRAMLLLLALSVLSSAAASTQTTILPTARTVLSMAVFRALPARFARVHRRFLTPSWATLGMGVVSAAFFVLLTLISPVLLTACINSIGLMIAFYFGITGFACSWYFRRTLLASIRNFFLRGLLPLLGGLMLTTAFVYGLIKYAEPENLLDDAGAPVTIFGIGAVAVVGIGAIVVGLVVMVAWWLRDPRFFRGETLTRRTHVLVMDQTYTARTFGTPDSGSEPGVVNPDLSNLPTGATAIDPRTGITTQREKKPNNPGSGGPGQPGQSG